MASHILVKKEARARAQITENTEATTSRSARGGRHPKTVLHFAADREKIHPTQKPVALEAWLIRTYTNLGETVLDCCMGSGSTGVACIHEGREFIGIEKDAEYFRIAKMRLEQEQEAGQQLSLL